MGIALSSHSRPGCGQYGVTHHQRPRCQPGTWQGSALLPVAPEQVTPGIPRVPLPTHTVNCPPPPFRPSHTSPGPLSLSLGQEPADVPLTCTGHMPRGLWSMVTAGRGSACRRALHGTSRRSPFSAPGKMGIIRLGQRTRQGEARTERRGSETLGVGRTD